VNKLDFAAIEDALDPYVVVPQWLPGGELRGAEYVVANPRRDDRNPGSFSINLRKRVWKDYASDDAGADMVSLYAFLFHGNNQGAAARELADSHGVRIGDPQTRERAANNVRAIDEAKPEPQFPVPAGVAEPSFKHARWGRPSHTYAYRDKDGKLLMYVCRFDPEGERKQVIPYSWCKHPDGAERWTWRGITGKSQRPLYGLDRLAAMPDADVIMVEGEKAADAGQELFGDAAVVVTWMGGVETADRASVRALDGRRVFLWPDFDAQRDDAGELKPLHEQPGMRAMMAIATSLKGVARETHMVRYTLGPERVAHGWDLADALNSGWSRADVLAYMGANTGDPWHVASGAALTPPAPPAPANDNKPAAAVPLDAAVNPFGFPHLSDKGQPMNTWENLEYLLGEYGITARYNVIKKDVIVSIPGRDYGDDSAANCALAEINSLCARNRMPKSDTADYMKLIGVQNRFNPAAQLIDAKPWDGVTRLPALYATLSTAPGYDRSLLEMLVRRWLISAVAAALKPNGFWSKGVLVLQGAQSLGKTAWIKALLPAYCRDLVKIGASIDPANKDTISSAIGHWVVELGELDGTFRKADIAKLKAFISQDIDLLRRPYDRLESQYQRKTVFFASVNPERFLADETGNVRWWTIPVIDVDYQHAIDVQQLWAEVAVLYRNNERWWLERDEEAMLEVVNRDHEAVDPLEERLLQFFDWNRAGMGEAMTATDVLLCVGFDRPTKSQATDCSRLLQKLTGDKPRKSGSRRLFKMPPRSAPQRDTTEDGRPF
jgi:putative DNA primase/helicase